MADDSIITIKLDPATAKRLADAAASEGVSAGTLAAEAVTEHLAAYEGLAPPAGMVPNTPEEIRKAIEEGREDFRLGRTIAHEDVAKGVHAIIAEAYQRQQK